MRQGVSRRRTVGLVLATACAGALICGTPFAQATAPVVSPVVTGDGPAFLPAGTDTYVAWTTDSKHTGIETFVRKFGSGRKRINGPGKASVWSGGIAGDLFTVQLTVGRRRSDIGLVDLRSRKIKKSPPGLNTREWEWSPTIDPDYVEFGRTVYLKRPARWKVLLIDRSSHHITTLASAPAKCRCLLPGQVKGSFATWTRCSKTNCVSYYYDIAAHQVHVLPKASGKIQELPVPNGTGTFYYVQSRLQCASTTQILRWTIGDISPTPVATLPAGYTVYSGLTEATGSGSQDQVYFDRAKCKSPNSKVFVIDDANARTAPFVRSSGRRVQVVGSGSAIPVVGARAGP